MLKKFVFGDSVKVIPLGSEQVQYGEFYAYNQSDSSVMLPNPQQIGECKDIEERVSTQDILPCSFMEVVRENLKLKNKNKELQRELSRLKDEKRKARKAFEMVFGEQQESSEWGGVLVGSHNKMGADLFLVENSCILR